MVNIDRIRDINTVTDSFSTMVLHGIEETATASDIILSWVI